MSDEPDEIRIHALCSCNSRLLAQSLDTFEEWLNDHEQHWQRIAIEHLSQPENVKSQSAVQG